MEAARNHSKFITKIEVNVYGECREVISPHHEDTVEINVYNTTSNIIWSVQGLIKEELEQ